MRKYLLAAAAAAAIATPAVARDGSGYVGVEGGLLFPRDTELDAVVNFESEDFFDIVEDDVAEIDYKTGIDLDVIAGYDFGMFRAEAELGWKRSKADQLEIDPALLDAIEEEGDIVFDEDDLDLDNKVSIFSVMGNALLDFGDDAGFGASVGAGFGRARVKTAGDKDSAWALQVLAGVRTAISDQIDVGLKYRYFRTGRLDFSGDFEDTDGNILTIGTRDRFRSHSLLASLIFNFAPPAPPPPPPPPPAPPPPEAPATQTCPDGSVILATDVCPAPPPPPPPPPPPAGERG